MRNVVGGTNGDRGILSVCGLTDEHDVYRLWHRQIICDTHARSDKGHAHAGQQQS